MKVISKEIFQKEISSMYGNTTAFVYDEPSNRYNYISAEVNDCSLQPFFDADRIKVCKLEDNSNVASVMIRNWVQEFEPSKDIQDDNFIPMIRNIFGEESKLYIAVKNDNVITYLLSY